MSLADADKRHWHREPEPEPEQGHDRDPDAGAWPEQMDVSFYADTSVTLPGHGNPGPGCGEWAPREFCDTCGEPHFGPHRCHQRRCPDCWTAWAARRVESITRRIQAARWSEPDGLERRAIHALLSPPPGEVQSLVDIRQARTEAIAKAKAAGVRGGVVVFHGFRVYEWAKEEWRESDTEMNLWEWVRSIPSDWREVTYWSPHFHLIGLSREFEEPEDTEWVCRRLSTLDSFEGLRDRGAYQSVAKVSQYLLSHATFEPNQEVKCVTWMGDLHSSNFTADPSDARGRKTEPVIEPPSVGAWKVIKRIAAEETRIEATLSDDGGEAPDCREPDCEGKLQPIWDARAALRDRGWCEQIGSRQQQRLSAAFEWAVGDVFPPPGLRSPRTEEECEEAFRALYGD